MLLEGLHGSCVGRSAFEACLGLPSIANSFLMGYPSNNLGTWAASHVRTLACSVGPSIRSGSLCEAYICKSRGGARRGIKDIHSHGTTLNGRPIDSLSSHS